jgi:hypothetical protein
VLEDRDAEMPNYSGTFPEEAELTGLLSLIYLISDCEGSYADTFMVLYYVVSY